MTVHPVEQLVMRQRITLMINRYAFTLGDDGPLVAFAQQKRMAFKEQVTFYADEAKTQPIFSFKARRKLDLGAVYDVFDADGQAIGWFKKDFKKSLLSSTWHTGVMHQGLEASGQERNRTVAVLRRLWDLVPIIGEIPVPWQFHFDFATADGTPVLSSQKRIALRDTYDVTFPAAPNGARMDWRVGACIAVALDALQSR
ncbi:hypothetical protein [Janibacter endophyticus]|uniref:hypothetical protein n=1 Tax=Janibacter endophyticus TaxID=2806261 RepID=UPI001F333E31|nr:hypothetical protein [Janibacter endophyticus]